MHVLRMKIQYSLYYALIKIAWTCIPICFSITVIWVIKAIFLLSVFFFISINQFLWRLLLLKIIFEILSPILNDVFNWYNLFPPLSFVLCNFGLGNILDASPEFPYLKLLNLSYFISEGETPAYRKPDIKWNMWYNIWYSGAQICMNQYIFDIGYKVGLCQNWLAKRY